MAGSGGARNSDQKVEFVDLRFAQHAGDRLQCNFAYVQNISEMNGRSSWRRK
jgi:hypothetical protein